MAALKFDPNMMYFYYGEELERMDEYLAGGILETLIDATYQVILEF